MAAPAIIPINFEKVVASLRKLGADAMDLQKPLNACIDVMTFAMQEEFRSQGHRTGGSWKKDSDEWSRRKARYKASRRSSKAMRTGYLENAREFFELKAPPSTMKSDILINTSRLVTSLTQRSSKEMVKAVKGNTLYFGSRVPYAKAHNEGKGHMPRRRFLVFTKGDMIKMRNEIRDYVVINYKRSAAASKAKVK